VSNPQFISQPNLSLAWADAFIKTRGTTGHRLSPLMLTFTGFDDAQVNEVAAIRTAVDASLAASDKQKVQTVANTIFPQSLWRLAKGNRQALYDEYRQNLPDYVAMAHSKNHRGLYFARLIAFDVDPKTGERLAHIPEGAVPENGNQLEFIITHCKKGVRNTMFQASTFDPARDHSASALLGFPCLQHVTFVPDFKLGTLAMNAFYATQQIFEKGYGNFLGLARLGLFMANQIGVALDRLTCFVGIEKMDGDHVPAPGAELEKLVAACSDALATEATGVSR